MGRRGKAFALGTGGLIVCAQILTALPVYANTQAPNGTTSQSIVSADDPQHPKCKPHKGEGLNPHCPPPVVPEAPVALLLPLSAAAVLGAAYLVSRRRNGPITA